MLLYEFKSYHCQINLCPTKNLLTYSPTHFLDNVDLVETPIVCLESENIPLQYIVHAINDYHESNVSLEFLLPNLAHRALGLENDIICNLLKKKNDILLKIETT